MRFFVFAFVLMLAAAPAQAVEVVTEPDGTLRPDFFATGADLKALQAEARAAGKRLAIVWQGVGDPDSETMMRENFTTPRVVEYGTREYLFVTLDFFGSDPVVMPDGAATTEMDLAIAQDITLLPAVMFLDDDGSELFRLEGYLSPRFFFAGLMFVGTGEHAAEEYRGMFVRWSRANSARWRAIFDGAQPLPN